VKKGTLLGAGRLAGFLLYFAGFLTWRFLLKGEGRAIFHGEGWPMSYIVREYAKRGNALVGVVIPIDHETVELHS
jgi:hypothetical protein